MVLKVAVIGAGASGLVTLKYLLEAKKFFPGVAIEACLFEKWNDIGGVFKHQVYEDAEVRFPLQVSPSSARVELTQVSPPVGLIQIPDGLFRLPDP